MKENYNAIALSVYTILKSYDPGIQ